MSEALRLYLVRHGQTAWSLAGKHTSSTDLALTEQGEIDARGLAPRLQAIQFTRVFSSPMLRARRTCELAGLESACEIDNDLHEWNYGAYEGRRSVEICKDRPDWNLWRDGCPDGESAAQVTARADQLLARLQLLSGSVALFLHGHIGAALAVRWLRLPLINGGHFPLHPTAICILGSEPAHPLLPAILAWNT